MAMSSRTTQRSHRLEEAANDLFYASFTAHPSDDDLWGGFSGGDRSTAWGIALFDGESCSVAIRRFRPNQSAMLWTEMGERFSQAGSTFTSITDLLQSSICVFDVVAGVGFEPTTFRL